MLVAAALRDHRSTCSGSKGAICLGLAAPGKGHKPTQPEWPCAGLLAKRAQVGDGSSAPPQLLTCLGAAIGWDASVLGEEGLAHFSLRLKVEWPHFSKQALVPNLQIN